MLSNPTTNLHQRQRQHRRQNSTPTAFDAAKVPTLPQQQQLQRNASHRRGISLDQRRQHQQRDHSTNPGLQYTQQQLLRETQQHRLVRPGHQQQQQQQQQLFTNFENDDNYLISPQQQQFDAGRHDTYGARSGPPASYSYQGPNNMTMSANSVDCSGSSLAGDNGLMLFPDNGSLTPSAYLEGLTMDLGEAAVQQGWVSQSGRPNSRPASAHRRISGGIANKVAIFEGLDSRPRTPPNQTDSCKKR